MPRQGLLRRTRQRHHPGTTLLCCEVMKSDGVGRCLSRCRSTPNKQPKPYYWLVEEKNMWAARRAAMWLTSPTGETWCGTRNINQAARRPSSWHGAGGLTIRYRGRSRRYGTRKNKTKQVRGSVSVGCTPPRST
jgi:hypothetical protein